MRLNIKLLVLFSILIQNIAAQVKENLTEHELQEVVVQASKTDAKLSEMPVSATVVRAGLLESAEIKSLTDVQALVPNFVMLDYGSKLTTPVYIRGIGSRINAPSIGLYVDNVPYFEKASFNFDFFDIEKIEVLRGPQGTLFGRNSMGGLINISSKSPLKYQGTDVKISAGNYGVYQMNAGHYGKLNSRLAFNLSLNYTHHDGFHENAFLNEKVDKLDSYGGRFNLIYQLAQKWTLEFYNNLEKSMQGGYPYALYAADTKILNPVNYNQRSSYERLLLSDALKVRFAGHKVDFTNTFAYQLLDDQQLIDQDFTKDSTFFAGQAQLQHTVSNEMVFQSKTNQKYQWLIGAFAFQQKAGSLVEVDSYKPATAKSPRWYTKDYLTTTQGAAFFHQSTYKIIPSLKVTAGFRFDYESSTMAYAYQDILKNGTNNQSDTVYPALSESVFLPKAAVNYDINKNHHLYASYSTGYKPGGFNSTFEKPEHLSFKSESSQNYELGLKSTLLKKWIYADLALFYTTLKNQQIYRTAPSGRGSYLDNSGYSVNQGVEVSVQNKAYKGFDAVISYGYTHAQIKEYVKSATENYNDKMTPYIPRQTLAVQLNQSIKVNNLTWLDLIRLNLSYNQMGEIYWNLTNTLQEETYGLLNAKISLKKANFTLEFWGKNLTNEDYKAFLFETGGKAYAQAGKPLQAGVNLMVKF